MHFVTSRSHLWVLSLGVAIGLGAVVGWWMRGLASDDVERVAMADPLPRPVIDVDPAPLPPAVPEPVREQERQDVVTEPPTKPASVADEFNFDIILEELDAMGMRIVPAKFLEQLHIPVIKSGDIPELTDEVIELFSLGEGETERINSAFATAATRLNRKEMEGLEIVAASETEATFKIPAIGELAQEIEGDLKNEVLNTLGEADGSIFLDLMTNSSGRYWNSFGQHEVEVTYSVTPMENGDMSLSIMRSLRNSDTGMSLEKSTKNTTFPKDPAFRSGRSFGRDGRRHDYVLDLLPETMRGYFDP